MAQAIFVTISYSDEIFDTPEKRSIYKRMCGDEAYPHGAYYG